MKVFHNFYLTNETFKTAKGGETWPIFLSKGYIMAFLPEL
jgi:hypothetical protein